MNLAHTLAEHAGAHPDAPALHLRDAEPLSYAELEARSARAAASLRARGVGTGDRVAIMLPNGPAHLAALFGTWKIGAIALPLNTLLVEPEVEARLELAGADVLVRDEVELENAVTVEQVAERTVQDPAVVIFTSGTSGSPKGAILTHGGIAAAARNAAEALALGPDDVVLGAAPFSHVLGLTTGVVATLSRGGAIAVEQRFEAERTLPLMVQAGVTILLGVPTMCIALTEAARPGTALPPLRIAHVGGAAVPAEVASAFERAFGAVVYEGYGLTELSGIATTYRAGELPKPGSVGRPFGGTEIRICDADANGIGEVQLRGPSVIPGYWNDAAATTDVISTEGWLSTGDVGYLDDEGYLFLVDRKKEVIIRGGYNVYPREVEEALYTHPDVLEAAVVGVADERLGEDIVAVVVSRPGAAPSATDIQTWVKARVASYKYPRRVVFVDQLPKGPTGKILKRAIDPAVLAGPPPAAPPSPR
jgi:long-chain acyl-CoA synthetase